MRKLVTDLKFMYLSIALEIIRVVSFTWLTVVLKATSSSYSMVLICSSIITEPYDSVLRAYNITDGDSVL